MHPGVKLKGVEGFDDYSANFYVNTFTQGIDSSADITGIVGPPTGIPPWEAAVDSDYVDTMAKLVKSFLAHKLNQAKQAAKSLDRYDKLRVCMDGNKETTKAPSLLHVIPPGQLLADTHQLNLAFRRYRDVIQGLVADGVISDSLGRDRLQAAKQLMNYAHAEHHVESIPRIFGSEYFVGVTDKEIKPFSIDDTRILLDSADERTRLYLLLALNCGMTQSDISNIKPAEFDAKAGTITRKRSKTRKQKSAKVVCYKLWPETLDLLKQEQSDSADYVLTTASGECLAKKDATTGKLHSTDGVRRAFNRLMTIVAGNVEKLTFKSLRKTSATTLEGHDKHERLGDVFLGHAARMQRHKFYANYSQDGFDDALAWLHDELLPPA